MSPTPDPVVLGQLLALALACGLNLYAVIAGLGIAVRLGWGGALPYELLGLGQGLILTSAVVLYLIEFLVDKVGYLDSVWDAVHTVVRPVAAALIAVLATMPFAWPVQLAVGFTAAVAALLTHTSKAGLRITLHARGLRDRIFHVSLAEDATVFAVVAIVLFLPPAAIAVVIAGCVVLALIGPPLWRAAWLGARGIDGRLRAFFGSPGWRERDDLPSAVARLVEPDELGIAPPRAMRAAADRLPGAGPFRNGWIVIQRQRVAFVYRSLLGPRRIDLPRLPITEVRPGFLADTIRLDGTDGITLFLLKDGPPLDVATNELNFASQ